MERRVHPKSVRFNKKSRAFLNKWVEDHELNNDNQAVNDIFDYAEEKYKEQKAIVEGVVVTCKLNRIKIRDLQSEW